MGELAPIATLKRDDVSNPLFDFIPQLTRNLRSALSRLRLSRVSAAASSLRRRVLILLPLLFHFGEKLSTGLVQARLQSISICLARQFNE